MARLRDGSVAGDPRLDRLVHFDERSRSFAVTDVIETAQPRSYTWAIPLHLDQGREGACVGFSASHELAARPAMVPNLTNTFARETVYWEAQKIDPWEGGSYPGALPIYEGTSVLAGVKILQRLGYISEYRWAFGLHDLRLALGYKGPAILGLNWYEGMFEPDAEGRIQPTGNLAGGHAILAYRNDEKAGRIWLHNSWGGEWGVADRIYGGGKCWLSHEDANRLLNEQGEACIPVKRSVRPAA